MMRSLLEPATYAEVRRPAPEARMLPPGCYVDPGFHRLELERVFRRAWLCLGHDALLAGPGDYLATEAAGVPLLVVRDEAGVVRAFANTCRHRGCRLVTGAGRASALRCPYHGWTYGLDGRLRGAPQMRHTRFDPDEHDLWPVRLERFGRLLFICLDPEAEDLAAYLGELGALLEPYAFDDLVLTRRREIAVPCNWKVYYENLLEPYHTPWVHAGGLAEKNEDEGAAMLSGNSTERFGSGDESAPVRLRFGANHAAIVTRHAGSRGLLPGVEPFPPRPGLAGPAAEGSVWAYLYPNLAISCQRETVWLNQVLPRGAEAIDLVISSCFPAATVGRADFEARVGAYYERLDRTAEEDLRIVTEQQAGLASPLARAGPVCHLEALCHAHRNWLLDRVIGSAPPGG